MEGAEIIFAFFCGCLVGGMIGYTVSYARLRSKVNGILEDIGVEWRV